MCLCVSVVMSASLLSMSMWLMLLPVVVVLFCPLFFRLCDAHQSKNNDDDDDDSDDRFNCNKLIILYAGNFEKRKQQKHK